MKFKADTLSIKQFEKMMQRIPKELPKVVAATLNKQAFDMKFKYMPEALQDAFVIRSPKFMNRQLRVNMAKKNKDPGNNFAEAGSIGGDRFTGWEEQQLGKVPEKKRTATIDEARSGDFSKKQRPVTRLKRGNKFRRLSNFAGKTKKQQLFNMLNVTREIKERFIVRNGEGNVFNLPDGVYGWREKSLKMLQSFKTPKVHKVDWLGDSVKRLFKNQGSFEKVFERELRKALRRANR